MTQNKSNLQKFLSGKITKIDNSQGKRMASVVAVKSWICDGASQNYQVDVTGLPDLKEGCDVTLDPVDGHLIP